MFLRSRTIAKVSVLLNIFLFILIMVSISDIEKQFRNYEQNEKNLLNEINDLNYRVIVLEIKPFNLTLPISNYIPDTRIWNTTIELYNE